MNFDGVAAVNPLMHPRVARAVIGDHPTFGGAMTYLVVANALFLGAIGYGAWRLWGNR